MDQSKTSKLEHCSAMYTCRPVTIRALLRTSARDKREPRVDAVAGRAIYADTVLWSSPDARASGQKRPSNQSQAGKTTSAENGAGGDLCKTSVVSAGARPSDLSLSFKGVADHPSQPGVGNRYHVCPPAERICISGSYHGLVQPVRSVMGIVSHDGCEFLCDGIGMGTERSKARNIQFGSGRPIHERSVYETAPCPQSGDQHGWTGPGNGQYFRGTPMADRKIRRNLLEGLRECPSGNRKPPKILPVLQPGTHSPIFGLSDSGRSLLPKGGPDTKAGYGNDRVALRSSLLGLCRAKFFSEKSVKNKNEAENEKQPMETAAHVEICKEHRFPHELGKAFVFPTVPTGSTGVFLINL
jgi:hypothetical protein